MGLKVLLITADGEIVENPRHYRQAEKVLKKAPQHVARRKQGSRRRAKAVRWCAKQQQHVRRQRADVHYQTALVLVRAYDTIDVEALQPATLSRRPEPKSDGNGGYEHNGARRKAGLNKRLQDAGWRHFLTTLAVTAACAGKRVEAVAPAYTTQKCSGCGERVEKSLSVRTPVCIHCGRILDRDANAAKTIVWRGQRLRGLAASAAGVHREPVGLEPRRSVSSRSAPALAALLAPSVRRGGVDRLCGGIEGLDELCEH